MPGDRISASVVIPTCGRPDYLDVALRSIAPQVARAGAELLVVDDGSADNATRLTAERHGARYLAHDRPRGLNAARNSGIEATRGELLVFTDDDVEVPDGWLDALLAAAGAYPEHDVFAGPIRPRLEGHRLRSCGREAGPITFLDLGAADREADFAWGANMTIRRRAFERLGPFDPTLAFYGEEEEWQRNYKAAGGRIRYVAAATLDHRRSPDDARISALARAAHGRGRAARRADARRGEAPTLARELRTLAGCVWHTLRRRCANGIVMAADSAGRVREALRPTPNPAAPDFLSGASGAVGGRRTALYKLADLTLDTRALAGAQPLRLARAARRAPPPRRVLVLGVDQPALGGLMDAARAELARSRHELEFAIAPAAEGRGKFENLNAQLAEHPAAGHDWLLVIDDDVELPRGFLDRFLFLAERFDLRLAQPAHRRRSHAAWSVTRRRGGSVVRETQFVEIGPVTALHADTFDVLLPFPQLRMGWGLDAHWGAVARKHGWKLGVIDATPVRHALRAVAAQYPHAEAIAEASTFLEQRPYVPRDEAQQTLVRHRSW